MRRHYRGDTCDGKNACECCGPIHSDGIVNAAQIPIAYHRYVVTLAVILTIEWVVLAITPFDRWDWALENVLVVIAIAAFLLSYRRLILSKISYTLICVFLLLHQIGAHYTYAQVPYDVFLRR